MRTDVIVSLFLIAVSPFLYVEANAFPGGAGIFPHLLVTVIDFLCLVQLAVVLRSPRSGPAGGGSRKPLRAGPYIALAAIALYVLTIQVIGFFVASGIFVIAMMFYLGERKPATYALAAGSILLFYYLLFIVFLHVPLPTGLLS